MALPQIHVPESNQSDRYRAPSRSMLPSTLSSPRSPSVPVPIPHMRDPVPPPLPPPKHIADIGGGNNGPDIAWQWGNSRHNEWDVSSVTPGSSLYGSLHSLRSEPSENARRTSSMSTIKSLGGAESKETAFPKIDEGYSSLSSTSIDSYRSVTLFRPGKIKNLLTTSAAAQSIPTPR